MRTSIIWCALLVVATAGACDTPATASDPRVAPRGDQQSREHESCAATVHCATGLRCYDNACRRADRSVLGDYAAALAARARSKGELDAAIALFAEALTRYEAESIPPPADIDCAYGSTLTAARSNKERAELAARVLHRCLVAVPGGAMRDQALRDLAELFETGLDPVDLARTSPADLYLTRAPARPDAAAVKVAVSADPVPTAKTFPVLMTRLGADDLRTPLVACWDAYATATKRQALAVQVPVKSRLVESEYDDEPDRIVVALEGAVPSGNSADATAAACVRAAVEPALKDLKGIRESFATTLTVRVQ